MKKETLNMKSKTKLLFTSLKLKSGFTLIEFLIVIAIMSLSVGSILLFLTSTLKGANQSNITAEVKQNGQSVLDNLQTQIRSSTKAEVMAQGYLNSLSAASGLFLTLSNGKYLNIACFNEVGTTANGYIGVYENTGSNTLPNGTASNYQAITNTDLISGVDIDCIANTASAGTFRVNDTTNNNLVIIDFTANQGIQAPSRVDYKANVQFKTTVGIRAYQ